MKRGTIGSIVTLAIAACVAQAFRPALAAAQQRPPSVPQPTFRAGAHSVEVDVTVQARDGRFVGDLARADFELLEDGVPQQIDTVFLVTGRPQGGAAASAPAAAAAETAGADVPKVGTDRRIFIFFFDTDHILSPASLDRARKAMDGFLARQFRAGDVGGIVADGRMMGNRLTSSVGELRASARGLRPSDTMRARQLEFREWPRLRDDLEAIRIVRNDREALQNAVTRACNDQPDGCRMAEQMISGKAERLATATRVASEATLRSTEALVSGLGRLPGLKVVVFFSDGFVVEDNVERLVSAVGRAGRAGVRVYSIDLRGLNRSPEVIDAPSADDPAGGPARFDLFADATNSLAVDTGGMAFRNENNVGRALDVVARDTGSYYVIGYRPARQEFDGKFRKITVRIRRPGVKVRARQGYLAVALPPTAPAPATHDEAESASAAAPPIAGVAFAATGASLAPSRRDARERIEALVERQRTERVSSTAASANALAREGWALYEKGDVEGARELLARAAAPDASAWVHYALGQAEFALQQYERAAAAWEVVLGRVPDFEPVYFDLADARLQQGELREAVAVLRAAGGRWPSDPEVFNALGVVLARRGSLGEAIEAFASAVRLAPDEPLGHYNLARAHHMKYVNSRRYVAAIAQWVSSEDDRKTAIAEYRKVVDLGGPNTASAREAIDALTAIW